MDYIILDASGIAIQYSSGDIVVCETEQEARNRMRSDDILVSISYCPDNGGGTDDSVQHFCQINGVDNNVEYGDFMFRNGDDFQDKLKDIFIPKID